jgi:hypothetical protein
VVTILLLKTPTPGAAVDDAVVTVTLDVADFVLSATEIAFTVTVAGFGTAPGAVYNPDVEIVPTVALPPVTLFTCQVTLVLLVLLTVAVNCCVPLVATEAVAGETATETGLIVTVAEADLVESATDVAFTVTVVVFATVVGAV